MADQTYGTPAIDIVRRGDDIVIRACVHDLARDDVHVSVEGGQLVISLPGDKMSQWQSGTHRIAEEAPPVSERPAASATGYGDVEPPISARDEQSLWNA